MCYNIRIMEINKDQLNIVDEADQVIGIASRKEIHQKGLLHREIHIIFYTPDGQLIFQHRAKDKDSYPDLLDVTVGGHVEIGSDYLATAIIEAKEETGVDILPEQLKALKRVRTNHYDDATGVTNNTIRQVYAYRYLGQLSDLVVEEGKALGFVAYPLSALTSFTNQEKSRFVPAIFSSLGQEILAAVEKEIKG